MIYLPPEKLEAELHIWWARRNVPAPVVRCVDGRTRPRWTQTYVRSAIRVTVRRLRYARSRARFAARRRAA